MAEQPQTERPERPLCPSATGETRDARIIGVIGADGVVQSIPTPITLTPAMRDSLGPQPERLFRLAGRCTANKCVNWDNRECGLIGRMRETVDAQVVATLPDGTLPDCGIRDACVWWRQSGAEACRVCRFVIYNPTP
jgi:hypothetical protein